MSRQLHVSVNLLTALVLFVTIVGCRKTDTNSPSPSAVAAATTAGRAQEYRINWQSNGEEIAAVELSIDGDSAISKVADVTERFDLKNQRWQHDETMQWVTLSQCKDWAKQLKEKNRKSDASVPEQIRTFVEWSLDPKFEIASAEETLTLTSGQVDYKIVVQESDRDLANYYRYARLNAYKKAMMEGKLAPFAELLVIEELERRRLLPKTMEVQIPGIPGAPLMLISTQIEAAN